MTPEMSLIARSRPTWIAGLLGAALTAATAGGVAGAGVGLMAGGPGLGALYPGAIVGLVGIVLGALLGATVYAKARPTRGLVRGWAVVGALELAAGVLLSAAIVVPWQLKRYHQRSDRRAAVATMTGARGSTADGWMVSVEPAGDVAYLRLSLRGPTSAASALARNVDLADCSDGTHWVEFSRDWSDREHATFYASGGVSRPYAGSPAGATCWFPLDRDVPGSRVVIPLSLAVTP